MARNPLTNVFGRWLYLNIARGGGAPHVTPIVYAEATSQAAPLESGEYEYKFKCFGTWCTDESTETFADATGPHKVHRCVVAADAIAALQAKNALLHAENAHLLAEAAEQRAEAAELRAQVRRHGSATFCSSSNPFACSSPMPEPTRRASSACASSWAVHSLFWCA